MFLSDVLIHCFLAKSGMQHTGCQCIVTLQDFTLNVPPPLFATSLRASGGQELNAQWHQPELCVLKREDTVSFTVEGHSQGHPAPFAGVSHPIDRLP